MTQVKPESTPYGYCPQCQGIVTKREKCYNGNYICVNGHKFKVKYIPIPKISKGK